VLHLGMDVGQYQVNETYQHTTLMDSPPSICPGRHLSDSSLYSIASCLLAVYDIKPAVDDQGNTIKLKPEFTNGLLTYGLLTMKNKC
jgi:hypothetical protein